MNQETETDNPGPFHQHVKWSQKIDPWPGSVRLTSYRTAILLNGSVPAIVPNRRPGGVSTPWIQNMVSFGQQLGGFFLAVLADA